MKYRICFDFVRSDRDWFNDEKMIEAEDDRSAAIAAREFIEKKNKNHRSRGHFALTGLYRVEQEATKEKRKRVNVKRLLQLS